MMPNVVPLSRGESLDREIGYHFGQQLSAMQEADERGASPEYADGASRSDIAPFIDSVLRVADGSPSPVVPVEDDSKISETLISRMIRGKVSVPIQQGSPRAAKRLHLMRIPCKVAGALLELALKLEWTSNKLTETATNLLDHGVLSPTLRYRATLEKFMTTEEVNMLMNTSFNGTSLTLFLYGHLMGHDAWRMMGVPDELLQGRREGAELLDMIVRFNMHTTLSSDGFSYVRCYTREGLPSIDKATTRSVHGVCWQLPPQVILLAVAALPNTRLMKVNARMSTSYVCKNAIALTSQYKATGLRPNINYLRVMTDAGSDVLPEAYLVFLRGLADNTDETQASQDVRHKNLVLSRALKMKKTKF